MRTSRLRPGPWNFQRASHTDSKPPAKKGPPSEGVPEEVGLEKTPEEQVGNAGFGATAAAAGVGAVDELIGVAAGAGAAELLPVLNVGVAALEGVNAIEKLRKGDVVVAETHFGNAAGCLATFVGTAALGLPAVRGPLLGASAVLGALGGALGLVAGVAEIRKGRQIMAATGSRRTLAMGILDILSGVTSLSGAAATALVGPHLGLPLMFASNVMDLAGIAVDYLGNRGPKSPAHPIDPKHARVGPPLPAGPECLSADSSFSRQASTEAEGRPRGSRRDRSRSCRPCS